MKIPTPLFDAWVRDAKRQLSARGRKAELARHLSARYGKTARVWAKDISAILSKRVMPNGEIVFAIRDWLAKNPAMEATDGATPRKRR